MPRNGVAFDYIFYAEGLESCMMDLRVADGSNNVYNKIGQLPFEGSLEDFTKRILTAYRGVEQRLSAQILAGNNQVVPLEKEYVKDPSKSNLDNLMAILAINFVEKDGLIKRFMK